MEEDDFIVIQAPMVTRMGLTGNRLLVYALIRGFCKGDGMAYGGGLGYICQWTNLTEVTARSILKSLIDDGLLFKVGNDSYSTIRPFEQNVVNDASVNEKHKKQTSAGDIALFEECWVAYRRKGSKKKALAQWKKMKDEDKELVLRHIQMYVGSRDLCYQKDFERYLRDNTFKEIIIKGNAVVFDPSKMENDDEYKPEQSLLLAWDEKRKINIFIGFWDGTHIPDGYNDDNRPDGARVMLNNSRGIIAWSKAERKWITEKDTL